MHDSGARYISAKITHPYGAPELHVRTIIVQIVLFGSSNMSEKSLKLLI
jgi:hypothetical protein